MALLYRWIAIPSTLAADGRAHIPHSSNTISHDEHRPARLKRNSVFFRGTPCAIRGCWLLLLIVLPERRGHSADRTNHWLVAGSCRRRRGAGVCSFRRPL